MQITPELLSVHRLSREEYDLIVKHIGREPNLEELGVFSAMWSEHCGYKNTKPMLKKLPTQGKRVVHGPGENAGVIDIDDNDAIAFKIESHNHPSAIEPYQGAATGVGGILRDIFTMGARPIAILDSLRFGNPSSDKTRHLIDGVVKGIAGYGNCMGIPTVSGEVFFEETYNQNILVNAMCVGLVDKKKIITSEASGIGNWLIYYGSTTGRDGVHGASFASAKLEDEGQKSAVQVGDPFLEKLLLEATIELIDRNLVIAAQDMGAAGITSSCTEMGSKGGSGVRINLDAIPKRASDITAYEMLLSESQERMVAMIDPAKWDEVKAVLDKWGIHGSVVGEIVPGRNFEVTYEGKTVVNLPLDVIIDKVPFYVREVVSEPEYFKNLKPVTLSQKTGIAEGLKALLASPNIAAKQWVYEQYDHMIGDHTTIRPGVGGASIVRIPGKKKGIAVTTDCNSRFTYLNPEKGAMIAVCESARNISALGAEPLAVTNCLNFGTPTDLDVYYQLHHCLQGMGKACIALETPITGGNASLYNEGAYGSIFPTPTIGMVGLIKDVNQAMTPAFKEAGSRIYLLGESREEIDGSEFSRIFYQALGKNCPEINLEFEVKIQKMVRTLIAQKKIQSADDLSLGGLAVALAKGAVKGRLGFAVSLNSSLSLEAALFGETQSRFLITVSEKQAAEVEKNLSGEKIPFTLLGKVCAKAEADLTFNGTRETVSLEELIRLYQTSFAKAIGQA